MHQITFHCRIISPMFLSGADGQTPELRAPSIKGALRFWWRACNGHLPLSELREKEDNIFGGVGGKKGNRSKVILRVENREIKIGQLPKSSRNDNPGINYLWYSIPMNDNRPGIWEGDFIATLSSFDKNLLFDAALSFWLLSNLGGIGTRSRRGAGSFQITSVKSNFALPNFPLESDSAISLNDHLTNGLRFISDHFDFVRSFAPNVKTDFPLLSNAGIHVINPKESSALAALEKIGRDYKGFRDRSHPDYAGVKSFIGTGVKPEQVSRAEFGLPLSFRYRSLNGAGADIKTTSETIDRSASSLFIHINKYKDSYCTILINFSSRLLPNSVDIKVSTQRRNRQPYKQHPVTIRQSYQGTKEQFISTLPNVEI